MPYLFWDNRLMRSALLGFAVLALAASMSAQEEPLTSLPYTPVLDTRFMDKAADPCVDFYQYACGNWNHLNPIPPDQSKWDVYSKLTHENQRFLWGILRQAAHGGASRSKNEQKIGDFFYACMDETSIDQKGATPIQPALDRIEGLQSKKQIAAFVASEHLNGNDGGMMFGFGSGQDFDNSGSMMAFAHAGGLGLPDRDLYLKTDPKSQETRRRYQSHIQRIFELLGEPVPEARIHSEAVLKLEAKFAAASLTRVEKRDPYKLKHKFTRRKLDSLMSSFDWQAYLAAMSTPSFQVVNVTEPKFFEALNEALVSEPLQVWKTYLRWHVLLNDGRWLSSNFAREHFEFYGKYLTGAQEMPPRWKECTALVDEQLGEALGQVFVAKTFSPSTKERALKMTREIEASMEQDLHHLTWMSDTTRQKAMDKLHAIVNKIGYPDHWRDYNSVIVTREDFLGDTHRAMAFEEHRDLNKIGKPVDRSEWDMSPPTVNAYYDAQMNDINFPAGVLEPPLFDPRLDDAPNYGNTGATIGHELTHGFDDEGRQFDVQGNLKEWWTQSDARSFEQRISCVRNQYAQYKIIDDININSKLTLGEDVADLGGTLLAYIAWKQATADKDLTPIDRLTPDQRFFVGMAQWACGYQRPESKRLRALTDPHSPNEYRINGVVSNLPEFGRAFSCHAGQPMMRANACRVW
jgi:endothelin-converting enzyme/putative endopeptidase